MTPDEPASPGAQRAGSRSLAEIGFVVLLALVALTAFGMARGYPTESAVYPMAIAGTVAALALAIAVREIVWRARGTPTVGSFALHGRRLALATAALVAYVASVGLVGFVLPSLAVALILPAIGGFKRHGLSFLVGAICVVAIILFFVIVLERPLPPDLLEPLWARFR